jgi:hypothetical protein
VTSDLLEQNELPLRDRVDDVEHGEEPLVFGSGKAEVLGHPSATSFSSERQIDAETYVFAAPMFARSRYEQMLRKHNNGSMFRSIFLRTASQSCTWRWATDLSAPLPGYSSAHPGSGLPILHRNHQPPTWWYWHLAQTADGHYFWIVSQSGVRDSSLWLSVLMKQRALALSVPHYIPIQLMRSNAEKGGDLHQELGEDPGEGARRDFPW